MRKQKQEEKKREAHMNKRFDALQASIKKLLSSGGKSSVKGSVEVAGFSGDEDADH